MELAIMALVLGPSILVFLIGCLLAFTRSLQPELRGPVRMKPRGRAV